MGSNKEDIAKENILRDLQPMFLEARQKGLWFKSTYQNLWFSPDELQHSHNSNKFVWGKANWTLADPFELVNRKEIEITNLQISLSELKKKIYNSFE